jgi:hypothetical protein
MPERRKQWCHQLASFGGMPFDTRMELFDDRERTDARYIRTDETMFEFIDRIARPELALARDTLNSWFRRWPSDDREELRSRLMAKDPTNFTGAFWELYLHEVHARLGFNVERDPTLPDVRTHPDFLLTRADMAFYLEATVVGVPDPVAARRRREELVIESINQAYHPDFSIRLCRIAVSGELPPRQAVIDAVEAWMATLDWDHELAALDGPPADPVHLAIGTTHLFVRPWPRAPSARGMRDFPTVATRTGEAGWFSEPPAILDDLKDKASKFGRPPKPYVIALLCLRDFTTDYDIEQALFGPEVVRAPVDPDGVVGGFSLARYPRGFWQHGGEQRATRVSAVLSAIHLNPWSISQTGLRLWRNPWARRPLPDGLPWATTDVDLQTGLPVHRESTIDMGSLLGFE